MAERFSIWIVGKDKEKFLGQCIHSCTNLTSNITYLDLGSEDASVETAQTNNTRTLHYDDFRGTFSSFCRSDWVLFLRPNEIISFPSERRIENMLKRRAMGYSVIIRDDIPPDILEDYLWIKMPHRKKQAGHSAYVSRVEIRLVQSRYFDDLLKLIISRSQDDVFPF